jgi:hypothetical protein
MDAPPPEESSFEYQPFVSVGEGEACPPSDILKRFSGIDVAMSVAIVIKGTLDKVAPFSALSVEDQNQNTRPKTRSCRVVFDSKA